MISLAMFLLCLYSMLILADLPWTVMTKSSQFCKVCDFLIPGSESWRGEAGKAEEDQDNQVLPTYGFRLKTNSHENEACERE